MQNRKTMLRSVPRRPLRKSYIRRKLIDQGKWVKAVKKNGVSSSSMLQGSRSIDHASKCSKCLFFPFPRYYAANCTWFFSLATLIGPDAIASRHVLRHTRKSTLNILIFRLVCWKRVLFPDSCHGKKFYAREKFFGLILLSHNSSCKFNRTRWTADVRFVMAAQKWVFIIFKLAIESTTLLCPATELISQRYPYTRVACTIRIEDRKFRIVAKSRFPFTIRMKSGKLRNWVGNARDRLNNSNNDIFTLKRLSLT